MPADAPARSAPPAKGWAYWLRHFMGPMHLFRPPRDGSPLPPCPSFQATGACAYPGECRLSHPERRRRISFRTWLSREISSCAIEDAENVDGGGELDLGGGSSTDGEETTEESESGESSDLSDAVCLRFVVSDAGEVHILEPGEDSDSISDEEEEEA